VHHSDKEPSATCQTVPTGVPAQRQYVPPDAVVIEQFARDVCSVLASRGHENFGKKEVVWSLANFLTLIAELTAKRLNVELSNHTEKKELG
jgi:hypothetical protein